MEHSVLEEAIYDRYILPTERKKTKLCGLEFSFGKEENLNVLYNRFCQYYTYVKNELDKEDHAITGMGINPHFQINQNLPVKSERYRMLLHHLSSYKKYGNCMLFHSHPNFGLFSCASQIQLDVEEKNLPLVLNTFTRLEPLKALILSNSPWGKDNEILCSRDGFWRNSLHGFNRHNVDMYNLEFETTEDVIVYMKSMSLYCVEREGKYINFPPIPLQQYFGMKKMKGEYFDGREYKTVEFEPRIGDLQYLRSFKFDDLTFRGTVEFRSVCEQPVGEIMSSGAFHAGLMEEVAKLSELLENDHSIYHHGYNATELRRMFVKRKRPEGFSWKEVSGLLVKVLNLAEDGLKKRGFGEEKFLQPLYVRAEQMLSPARQMVEGMEKGRSLDDYIEEYGGL
ncbi:MAG: glutamylcysteine synthetase [Eubacterium sp.]|nr:glutamylcysteine synthetase [Eubacterium sp.]